MRVLAQRALLAGALLLAAVVALAGPAALADPIGTYRVVGTNPDSGGEYRGTVTVTRTGETYSVVWQIGNTRFVGTGLGAVIRNGGFFIGPAESSDSALAIGYASGNSFGMAMYFEREDGRWEGVWTYGGSDKVATEVWYPR